MPANTSFTAGQVLTAQQMTNLPWGVVQTTAGGTSSRGFIAIAVGQTVNQGVTTDVTNSSMTFTGIAGRIYSFSIGAICASTSASGLADLFITDGSNNLLTKVRANLTNSSGTGHLFARYIFTATGATTVKCRFQAVTGNCSIFDGNIAGYVVLEDLGPST
jgi:hypothetical protein